MLTNFNTEMLRAVYVMRLLMSNFALVIQFTDVCEVAKLSFASIFSD